jgi:hypothetical protein
VPTGALTAMMLSVGYTAVEVFKILIKFNFNDLLDDSWDISTDLYRVYNEYGFYKGGKPTKIIKQNPIFLMLHFSNFII